jgi:hypothetical protein
MAKTITFKPEFEKKLKKLKIKTKFVKNWKANKWATSNPTANRELALQVNSWEEFIMYAFGWNMTSEGYDYWYNISEL